MFATEDDKYRLLVAIRVDRFIENIQRAMDYTRETTTYGTKYPEDVTNFFGEPLGRVFQGTTVSPKEFAAKTKRVVIMFFLSMCFMSVIFLCCYCTYLILRCRCDRRRSKISLYENQLANKREAERQVAERFEVQNLAPVEPVLLNPLIQVKPKRVKWCNGNTTVQDTVIPFFLCLLGKCENIGLSSSKHF